MLLRTAPRSISRTSRLARHQLFHHASSMTYKNRLAQAKSPYLLQHQENPVDWLEWSEEAFKLAQKEEKPVILSVGYAACHWCHVMAHESFEDEDVAKMMNENFISVKVDREERPDIDRVYMTYLQATSGRGGWPATYFLTPELTPIWAGTYLPKPTFLNLMGQVSNLWAQKSTREKLRAQGDDVMKQLRNVKNRGSSVSNLQTDRVMSAIYKHWKDDYDPTYGGFGEEPKFPSAALTFYPLHRFAAYTNDKQKREQVLKMTSHTLKSIERGGIRDHVANGISRYSVDEKWLLPHFEKMLYDHAQLLTSALDAALLAESKEDKIELEKMAAGIVAYLETDLLNKPGGGFFCAEDADSLPGNGETEKKEGAFYVWTYQKLYELLGKDIGLFAAHFGVQKGGNVPKKHDIQGELAGTNVLAQQQAVAETASRFKVSPVEARRTIDSCLDKLRSYRDEHRPRPHLDDKILTAWNGLTISALARVAEHPFEPASSAPDLAARESELANINERALKMAQDAVAFIKTSLWDEQTKSLHRSFREGKGPHAQADDYAFLIAGLLDLLETTGNAEFLEFATILQERQDDLFYDQEDGGYFASPVGDPYVLIRLKEHQEGAEPTAIGVSVSNLYRLGHLLDDKMDEYTTKAQACVESAGNLLARAPFAMGTLASNAMLDEDAEGIKQIILTGEMSDPKTRQLLDVIRKRFIPNRLVIQLSPEQPQELLETRNEVIKSLVDAGQHREPAVRICEGRTCGLPIAEVEELEHALIAA